MSKTDPIGYPAAHCRVSVAFGKAKEHACVDCGEQAQEWSYDGLDPDEWWDIWVQPKFKVMRYSLDLDRYQPRCQPCHSRFDSPTHCQRGHEWTPENTRIRPSDSRRVCRACEREREKRRPPRRRSH